MSFGWGLGLPAWLSKMFCGFKSRWTMPLCCNAFIAPAVNKLEVKLCDVSPYHFSSSTYQVASGNCESYPRWAFPWLQLTKMFTNRFGKKNKRTKRIATWKIISQISAVAIFHDEEDMMLRFLGDYKHTHNNYWLKECNGRLSGKRMYVVWSRDNY